MANPHDPVFEIDAGKILAKLHLAGLEQLQAIKVITINTGIVNPVAQANPKNPGNVEFDLENKSGEYLFGVLKRIEYQVPIDITKNKKIIKLQDEIKNAKAKEKLTDKAKDRNSATYKVLEKILKELESFKIQKYKADPKNFDKSIKEFNDAVKIENEERKNKKEENIQKLLKIAYNDIKTYFKTISGEKNSAKIKESDIVKLNADVDGNIKDPTQFKDIKDFKITSDIDKKLEKYEQDIQISDKPNIIVSRNIIFVVGFSVEVETM